MSRPHPTDLRYVDLPIRPCRECGAPLPEHRDFFYIHRGYMRRICRQCMYQKDAAMLKRNPVQRDRQVEKCRQWRERNPERAREISRRSWHRNKFRRVRTGPAHRPKWVRVRDVLREKPELLPLTCREIAAHLPEDLSVSVCTINRARNILLSEKR